MQLPVSLEILLEYFPQNIDPYPHYNPESSSHPLIPQIQPCIGCEENGGG